MVDARSTLLRPLRDPRATGELIIIIEHFTCTKKRIVLLFLGTIDDSRRLLSHSSKTGRPWEPYMFFGMDGPAGHQQMPVSRERMTESGCGRNRFPRYERNQIDVYKRLSGSFAISRQIIVDSTILTWLGLGTTLFSQTRPFLLGWPFYNSLSLLTAMWTATVKPVKSSLRGSTSSANMYVLVQYMYAATVLIMVFLSVRFHRKVTSFDYGEKSVCPDPIFQASPVGSRPEKRSLAATGWTPASNIPMMTVEAACVWHHDEFWCPGGYLNDKVASYSPETDKWTMRPSLLAVTHHIFGSAFSVMNGTRILVIGGLNNQGDNHGARLFNTQMLDSVTSDGSLWYDASDELGIADLDLRGMVSCTRVRIEDDFYCIFASDRAYVNDTLRFFAFNDATLHFRALPVPPEPLSHVTMIADPLRHRLIYGMGRSTSSSGISENLHFFDTNTETWNEVDPIQSLPQFIPRLEARGFYQDPTNYQGYLFGGQDQHRSHVSDLVHKFSFSSDPADRKITFEHWSRLPLQAHFGSGVGEVPPGSGRLMVVGGSTAVGPHGSNKVWFWDQSQVPLMALELQRREVVDNASAPQFSVVSAMLGTHDVTHAVQTLLDEGWTDFVQSVMPDLGLVEEWQWRDGSWPHFIKKKRNGKIYRVGTAKEQLSVTLQEPNRFVRVIVCPMDSGCKFSWWQDREEREYLYQHNLTKDKPFNEHMASF